MSAPYWGKFAGVIQDNADPKKLGRIKCLVPEIFGDQVTDWAWPNFPIGGDTDTGQFGVPPEGANVWVEFRNGNPDLPIWTGVFFSEPSSQSDVPQLAREVADESTRAPKGTDVAVTESGLSFPEPPSAYATIYPNNHVRKTPGGHIEELDDTPGRKRRHHWHPSGSYEEVRDDGSRVLKIMSNNHRIAEGTEVNHIKESQYNVVELDQDDTVRGNATRTVVGTVDKEHRKTTDYIYRGKVTEQYDAEHEKTVNGQSTETYAASKEEIVVGGKLLSTGNNYTQFILETLETNIANFSAAAKGRILNILLGDYDLNVILGDIDLTATAGNVSLSTLLGTANLDGTTTHLGTLLTSTEAIVLGNLFLALYNSHTHLGNLGFPTGPPIIFMSALQLSTQVFSAP